MFVIAPSIPADLADLPDPASDQDTANAGPATRSSRFLHVIRRIIEYGKELAGTLRRHNGPDEFTAMVFGTTQLALILQRITLGLHRAAALEARVIRGAPRLDRPPAPDSNAWSDATPPKPTSRPAPAARQTEEADPVLARMPTPAAIAADLRRRPIGEVLVDICLELGIPMWPELQAVIHENNGDIVRYIRGMRKPRPDKPVAPPSDSAPPLSSSPQAVPPFAPAFAAPFEAPRPIRPP